MPPDQMQTRIVIVLTIHHRHERSYGNAWVISADKPPVRLIGEIVFPDPPKENHLLTVLGALAASFESRQINLGRVGELYLPSFSSQIQDLLEKRAEGIFASSGLGPLEKARKIFNLITLEGMEAKYKWIELIHELAFKGGALTLFDAELCEARLFHEQSKDTLGRKYL